MASVIGALLSAPAFGSGEVSPGRLAKRVNLRDARLASAATTSFSVPRNGNGNFAAYPPFFEQAHVAGSTAAVTITSITTLGLVCAPNNPTNPCSQAGSTVRVGIAQSPLGGSPATPYTYYLDSSGQPAFVSQPMSSLTDINNTNSACTTCPRTWTLAHPVTVPARSVWGLGVEVYQGATRLSPSGGQVAWPETYWQMQGTNGNGTLIVDAADITNTSGVWTASGTNFPFTISGSAGVSPPEGYGFNNPSERAVTFCQYGDPIDPATGNFSETTTDIAVPGRGIPLRFSRTYNSLAASTNGPLGFGWTHAYGPSLSAGTGGTPVTITQENGSQVLFELSSGTYTAPPKVTATLTHNADGTWTLVRGKRQTLSFDTVGRLTSLRDINGYLTSLSYNGTTGQLQSVTDPAGRSLTVTWTGSNITKIADPAGRTVTYAYDAQGDLTDVIDVAGGHSTFTYDSSHRMTTSRSAKYFGDTSTTPSPITTNDYDTQGRVDWQTDPLGHKTTFDYTSVPGSTIVTDPNLNKTRLDFASGQCSMKTVGYTSAQAAAWTYSFDAISGGISAVSDPNSHTIQTNYDSQGNVVSTTDALARTTSYTYDSLNDPVTITEAKKYGAVSVTTTRQYDSSGNLKSVSTPLLDANGNVTATQTSTYTYGDSGHPGDITSMSDANQKTTNFTYDTNGDLASQTDPLGNATRYCYDAVGRGIGVIAPLASANGVSCANLPAEPAPPAPPVTPPAHTTSSAIDAFGHIVRTVDGLGHDSRQSYDANQNFVSQTDGNGNTATGAYNPDNWLTGITRADGTSFSYSYDGDGNQTSYGDGQQHATTWTFTDSALPNAPTAMTSPTTAAAPNGISTSYSYDGAGNRISVVNGAGQTTAYSYDAANEVTAVSYSDGSTQNVSNITYDADGQRTAMTDGTGTSSWAYDSLHRLTSTTDGSGATVSYGYDLNSQVTSIVYPGNTTPVSRNFDDAGRLSSVSDWLGHNATFSYDADSNLAGQTNPNSTGSTYGYDNADQITAISHTQNFSPPSTFASFMYGRDGAGQVNSVATSGAVPADTHNYSYTQLEQLTGVDGANYRYDHADNLTTRLDGITNSYDQANELTTSALPISFVAHGEGTDNVGTATSIGAGLSQVAGHNDVILIASTAPQGARIVAPTGYVLVNTYVSNGTQVAVYRYTAVGGETGVSLNYPDASATKLQPKTLAAVVYHNVDPVNPVDATSSAAASSSTSMTVPTLNTSMSGEQLVLVESADMLAGVAGTWSPQLMTTESHSPNGTFDIDTDFADQPLGAAGSTGPRNTTYSGTAAQLAGALIALKPLTVSWHYDNRGNQTGADIPGSASLTYTYDQADRLTAFNSGSTTASYRYSGDGLRTSRIANGTTTNYVWDQVSSPAVPLTETINGVTYDYVYGPGNLPLERILPQQFIAQRSSGSDADSVGNRSTLTANFCCAQFRDQILVATTLPSSANVTDPNGYTSVATVTSGNTKTLLWRRTANGGESTLTISYPNGGTTLVHKTLVVIVFSDVDPNNPIDTQSQASSPSSPLPPEQISAPALTTTATNDELVLFDGANGTAPISGNWNFPNGFQGGTSASTSAPSDNSTLVTEQQATQPGSYGPFASSYSQPTTDLTTILLALRPAAQPVEYFHHDQLGSTRALTDNYGTVIASATYDPYGNAQPNSTVSQYTDLGFGGQQTDSETGLIYLRARYYNPWTAQFLTRDPAVALTQSPYGYVQDNPLNGTDVTGLACRCDSTKLANLLSAMGDHPGDTVPGGLVGALGETARNGTLFPTSGGGFTDHIQEALDIARGLANCMKSTLLTGDELDQAREAHWQLREALREIFRSDYYKNRYIPLPSSSFSIRFDPNTFATGSQVAGAIGVGGLLGDVIAGAIGASGAVAVT